ncbi:MAG: hypothetical protein M1820_010236, partial [Bogoriella megaspora]
KKSVGKSPQAFLAATGQARAESIRLLIQWTGTPSDDCIQLALRKTGVGALGAFKEGPFLLQTPLNDNGDVWLGSLATSEFSDPDGMAAVIDFAVDEAQVDLRYQNAKETSECMTWLAGRH